MWNILPYLYNTGYRYAWCTPLYIISFCCSLFKDGLPHVESRLYEYSYSTLQNKTIQYNKIKKNKLPRSPINNFLLFSSHSTSPLLVLWPITTRSMPWCHHHHTRPEPLTLIRPTTFLARCGSNALSASCLSHSSRDSPCLDLSSLTSSPSRGYQSPRT